jgi:Protein of unknown function (DUF559)
LRHGQRRTAFLAEQGYCVFRISNDEVLIAMDQLLTLIHRRGNGVSRLTPLSYPIAAQRAPFLPPLRGREDSSRCLPDSIHFFSRHSGQVAERNRGSRDGAAREPEGVSAVQFNLCNRDRNHVGLSTSFSTNRRRSAGVV